MKTSIKKLLSASFAIAILLGSTSVFAISNPTSKKESKENSFSISEAEINEILSSLEDNETEWLEDEITYQIFDSEDNLIMEKVIQRNAPVNNEKLVKLLAQSDFIMTYNNSSYYRLSEH